MSISAMNITMAVANNEYNSLKDLLEKYTDEMSEEAKNGLSQQIERLGKAIQDFFISYLEDFDKLKKSMQDEIASKQAEIDKFEVLIQQLNKKIEALNKQIPKSDLNWHMDMCAKKYPYWEMLSNESKTFIASSHYLLSFIRAHNIELSSVIIEQCKAVENELLEKIYSNFIIQKSRETLINDDSPLMQSIKNFRMGYKIYVPLKAMFISLRSASNNSYQAKLHDYLVEEHWNTSILQDEEFIDTGIWYTENVRNKAAHSFELGNEDYNQCATKTTAILKNLFEACP